MCSAGLQRKVMRSQSTPADTKIQRAVDPVGRATEQEMRVLEALTALTNVILRQAEVGSLPLALTGTAGRMD
jgi:hypothetical protein